jgi:plasmid stability protein
MTTMIQIRNVPDVLHRKLKSRAALASMSLSDYLLREIREVAERPTMEELEQRLQALPRVTTSISAADLIREERDRR